MNYKHLHYFWAVAREGSITRAAEVLHVTQPAISAQIARLESQLGAKLFSRRGRNLVLTLVGRTAFGYANEIFTLGEELEGILRGGLASRPVKFTVGVSNALPKLVAYRLLAPALALEPAVRLTVRDDRPDRLLADLAIHELDLVLTDSPLTPAINVRAYSHLLGESGVSIFGTPTLRDAHGGDFPRSLDGAPMFVPTENSTLRRSIEQWISATGIRPAVIGEVEDSALLKVFGQAGVCVFAGHTVVEAEIQQQYGVELLGRLEGVGERFYAISGERRLQHPAVVAISAAARQEFLPGRSEPVEPGGSN
jgi:LysR family transcriptional regulator, transcriptional activator of nhaA